MKDKKDLLVLPAVENIEEIIAGLSTPVNLTKGKYTDLEFRFEDNQMSLMHLGVDIKEFSNVWISSSWGSRDLAYAVSLYLDFFSTLHTHVEKVTSKITDQAIFAINQIPSPNTFFIDGGDITSHVDTIESICSYPLIIKDITGSGGVDSLLIGNRSQLIKRSASLPKNKKYLYQKYIPNDYDWGILVANGKIVSGEKSYCATGEFRNNCNGAKEVFIERDAIPEQIQEMAVNASSILGLSWSRSDIIVDHNTGLPYLMEVNRYPGITSGTSEVYGAQSFLESYLNSKY